jgi:hypothetical protein
VGFTDTPSARRAPFAQAAQLAGGGSPPVQPNEARSTGLSSSAITTMRNQYGSRHTIAFDSSDIGSFETPSNVNYVLSGPYSFNVQQSAADYYLHIPAEVVRDSLLVDVKITRGDRPANGTGAFIAVCTDEPNPVCSPSGKLFEIQPGEAGNDAAYDRKDIKVSLGQYVPRTQSIQLKLTCILDNGNGSCEWKNFRFYEDLRPWMPAFSTPTTNRTFSSTASTFDGIIPRQSGNSFAAIRVKGDNNETRYRSSLVVLPQLCDTKSRVYLLWRG